MSKTKYKEYWLVKRFKTEQEILKTKRALLTGRNSKTTVIETGNIDSIGAEVKKRCLKIHPRFIETIPHAKQRKTHLDYPIDNTEPNRFRRNYCLKTPLSTLG